LQDPAHAKFLVKDRLLPFLAMGGVRLEDNVLVTEQGAESVTSVPRTVEEVEAVMAGGAWKGL
jgi:Xaa-Pro dipeptidase